MLGSKVEYDLTGIEGKSMTRKYLEVDTPEFVRFMRKEDFAGYRISLSLPSIEELFTSTRVHELSLRLASGIRSAYKTLAVDKLFLGVFSFHLQRIMYEGMKNAFEHGNKWNSEKPTIVRWNLCPDLVNLSILDGGEKDIDLTPKTKRIINSDTPGVFFSGGGKGVEQIRDLARNAFRGEASWVPNCNEQGNKVGTELKVVVPTFWFMHEWSDLAPSSSNLNR